MNESASSGEAPSEAQELEDTSPPGLPSSQISLMDLTNVVRWTKVFVMGILFLLLLGVALVLILWAEAAAALGREVYGTDAGEAARMAALVNQEMLAPSPWLGAVQGALWAWSCLVWLRFRRMGDFRAIFESLVRPRFRADRTHHAALHPYPRTGTGFALVGVAFWLLAVLSPRPWRGFDTLGAAGFLVCALAVARLHRTRLIKADGAALCRFLDALERAGSHAPAAPPRAPARGALCAAAGFGVFLAGYALGDSIHGLTGLAALTTPAGVCLLMVADYHFQPSYADLRDADARPPVLFLRSFRIDQSLTLWWSFARTFWRGPRWRAESLEQRLARLFSAVGPFVGLEAHGRGAVLGAIRLKRPLSDWQDTVLEQMSASCAIVMIPGSTGSVDWELRKIAEQGFLHKTLFVFPPLTGRPGRKARGVAADLLTRLQGLVAAAAPSPPAATVRPVHVRCVAFDRAGQCLQVVSRSPGLFSCELAALLAFHWQERTRLETLPDAAVPARVPAPVRRKARCLDVAMLVSIGAPVWLLVRHRPPLDAWLVLCLWGALALATDVICVGRWGMTVGQAIAGLRVQRRGAATVGYTRALARLVLLPLDLRLPGMREAATGTAVARAEVNGPRRRRCLTLWWLLVWLGGAASAAIYVSS